MGREHHIRFIEQNEIDKARWDNCLDNAPNGLIYGYSQYLDLMSKNWSGLVLNDYEAVMPLPWNRKYGIHYLYQPAFTPSLGVFGQSLDESIISLFIEAIPRKFKLVEIALNHGNLFGRFNAASFIRHNYALNLKNPYEHLYKNYKENIRRNIKKAQQNDCTLRTDIPVADIITLSKPLMRKSTNINNEDYNNFDKLFHLLHKENKATSVGVFSKSTELIASCVYFFSHNRAYYILVGNHQNGKTTGASHYLIDSFIKEHAGQNLILDFEGSDNPNLAFFYSSFGASLEPYPWIKINNLPFWLKPFK